MSGATCAAVARRCRCATPVSRSGASRGNAFKGWRRCRALYENEAGNGDEPANTGRVRDVIAAASRGSESAPGSSPRCQRRRTRVRISAARTRAASAPTHGRGCGRTGARRILHVVGERLDFPHDRISEVAYDPDRARRKRVHCGVATRSRAHRSDLEPHGRPRIPAAGQGMEKHPLLARRLMAASDRLIARHGACVSSKRCGSARNLPNVAICGAGDRSRASPAQFCVPSGRRQSYDHLRRRGDSRALGDRLRSGWVLRPHQHHPCSARRQSPAVGAARRDHREARRTEARIAAHLFYS